MEHATLHDGALGRFVRIVNGTVDWIGRVTSLLIFVLIGILLYGVIMRYLIGRPSIWAGELSGMLYAVYFLIGGAYALTHMGHVNVNILRQRLPPRVRAAVDLVTWCLFYMFIGVIFWLGIGYAWTSFARMETSASVWRPYIWPIKMFLPISAFLMLMVGFTKTLCDIYILWKGGAPEEKSGSDPDQPVPGGNAWS